MQIPPSIRRVIRNVLDGPGHSSRQVRKAAFHAEFPALPEALRPYVTKTAKYAHRIVDRDIDGLRAAGYDDDQIFEITVCSALGAGFARMERGLAAMEEV